MKLTKASVEKIPYSENGQLFYRDSELKGFGLRVTKSCKTYIVETSVRGKTCRVTIGKHGVFTAEQARTQAKQHLANMAMGINPNQQKSYQKTQNINLKQAFNEFLTVRELKPHTRYDYTRCFEVAFKPWQQKTIMDITKPMVATHYEKLCQTHGKAYANLSMRFLRSLLNFASATYEDQQGHSLLPENAVNVLSQKKQWKVVGRRQNVIKPHQLAAWWQAVQRLENDTFRDYFVLLLFTGLRRQEAAQLAWENIDFNARTMLIPETKNKLPLTLPLSNYLYDLFHTRQQTSNNPWVFPSKRGNHPIKEPRQQIIRVTHWSGIEFSCHDLRRTFATIAEGLNVSEYTLKRLLNHKQSDVTAGYIINDVERLRVPMQQITDALLEKCQLQKDF